jgi:tetratricopeptide (TPR) repeat protein
MEGQFKRITSYARYVWGHVCAVCRKEEPPRVAWSKTVKHARRLEAELFDETVDHKKAVRLTSKAREDYKQKNYSMAEFALREALTHDRHYVPALTCLGLSLYKMNRAREAVKYWQKAISLDPYSKAADKARRALNKLTPDELKPPPFAPDEEEEDDDEF